MALPVELAYVLGAIFSICHAGTWPTISSKIGKISRSVEVHISEAEILHGNSLSSNSLALKPRIMHDFLLAKNSHKRDKK